MSTNGWLGPDRPRPTGCQHVAIANASLMIFPTRFRTPKALHAIGALLHDAATANRHFRVVSASAKLGRGKVGVLTRNESALPGRDSYGAREHSAYRRSGCKPVVQPVWCACRRNRTDELQGARSRTACRGRADCRVINSRDPGKDAWVIAIDTNPVHSARGSLLFAHDGKVVFRPGKATRRALQHGAGAHPVDHHAPLVAS